MDAQLAAIYGTGQGSDDLEKVAAAELLIKIAEDQGVNLDDLSDEEVAKLLGDMTSKDKESEGDPSEEEDKEEEDKEEEKVAEADYLGRVMAHAYVQELGNIEKTALSKVEVGMRARNLASKLPGVGNILEGLASRKAGKGVVDAARSGASKAVSRSAIPAQLQGRAASKLENLMGAKGRKTMSEGTKSILTGAAKAGGTVAGLGAVGYGAKKALSKESSALDTLAEQRANEMLIEAGYTGQEKQASSVESAVEHRALQMLEAAGYPVNWE